MATVDGVAASRVSSIRLAEFQDIDGFAAAGGGEAAAGRAEAEASA